MNHAPFRVLVATDLTSASEPALIRARDHARAAGAILVVCHIVPAAVHNNPLFPQRNETEVLEVTDVLKRAGDLVDEQLTRLEISPDETKIIVESGNPEEEIIRIAEEEEAALIVLGADAIKGPQRAIGHVAERVVRYAHAPVLVARAAGATGRILVATDFSESAQPAHEIGALLVKAAGVEATLLHVLESPSTSERVASATAAAMSALGSPWLPLSPTALAQLRELGMTTLRDLADQHHFAHVEQIDGTDAASTIVEQAKSMSAEMIVIGSRGHTRLRRLVLGSVAEAVVRQSACSVLVARETAAQLDVAAQPVSNGVHLGQGTTEGHEPLVSRG